jgi:beta-xylosidase
VSDHFNNPSLHLQWQWAANEQPEWYSLSAKAGFLRLYAVKPPNGPETLLYDVPNVLCQKISSASYTVTAKLMASSIEENDHAGVVITGSEYASVSLTRCSDDRERLKISLILGFPSEGRENEYEYARVAADKPLYIRVSIAPNALCIFSYSLDNVHFNQLGPKFEAQPDHWVGSKIGLFCINKGQPENNGYIDFDWILLDKNTI